MTKKKTNEKEEREERACNIVRRRLQLEEELRVFHRREQEIKAELNQLQKNCPHLNIIIVDYEDGGRCQIRERCNDCKSENYRGCLSAKAGKELKSL